MVEKKLREKNSRVHNTYRERHRETYIDSYTHRDKQGKCFEHKDWPRESISGEKGGCAPIAAYYICFDLSVNVIELLKTEFHEELSLSDSSSI